MVGGSPIRSRLKRRSSVTRSASGEGVSPSFSRRARMNLSIGVLTHPVFLTSGGAGRSGFTNAQCFLIADCGPWSGMTADCRDAKLFVSTSNFDRRAGFCAAEDDCDHWATTPINAAKTITTAEEIFLFLIDHPGS